MESDTFMLIFDVILLGLGVVLLYKTFDMKKKTEVPEIFIPAEEMNHCKDKAGFVKYLYPNALIFGIITVAFGAEGTLADTGKIPNIPSWVSMVMVVAFIVVWVWFSHVLRKGRREFFYQ